MRRELVLLLAVALVASLVACSPPLPQVPEATATSSGATTGSSATPAAATGTVKFSIPNLAPWVQYAVAHTHSKSKAFVEADWVSIEIDKQVDEETWASYTYLQAYPSYSATPGNTPATSVASTSMPAGNYRALVSVGSFYTTPGTYTVSGSADFTINAGETTYTTVTCIPNNYTDLDEGLWSGYGSLTSHQEQWFWVPSYDSERQTYINVQVGQGDTLYCFVFYGDGTYTGSSGAFTMDDGISSLSVPASSNGYWVAIWDGSSNQVYAQVSWSPNALGDVVFGIE